MLAIHFTKPQVSHLNFTIVLFINGGMNPSIPDCNTSLSAIRLQLVGTIPEVVDYFLQITTYMHNT